MADREGIVTVCEGKEGYALVDAMQYRMMHDELARLRTENERLRRLCRDGFDSQRVLEWISTEPRKPATVAFTEGGERQAAYLIEMAEAALRARVAELEGELHSQKQMTESYRKDAIAYQLHADNAESLVKEQVQKEMAELRAEISRLRNKKCIHQLVREFAQSTEPA